MPRLTLAWRLARREFDHGLVGFRVFLICLALGVAAIAGVGSTAKALLRGLEDNGRAILGGDVEARLVHREANPKALAWMAARGEVSTVAEMPAMAAESTKAKHILVELKAVDGKYPLYGAVALKPKAKLAAALAESGGRYGAVVGPSVLGRLDLKVGDALKVGDEVYQIRGIIAHEPDAIGGRLALGPSVIVALPSLAATKLINPASLVHWDYRIRLPQSASAAAFAAALERAFPDAGWEVHTFRNGAPGTKNWIDRATRFFILVGLTMLLIGGVGVGNAVETYLERRTVTIAILKSLGASSRLLFEIYLLQVLALAMIGIAIGLVVGAALPFGITALPPDWLPAPAHIGLYPLPLVEAAACGFLVALAFALWPLARIRDVSAGQLFRDLISPARNWPNLPIIAIVAALTAALAGLAVLSAGDNRLAIGFIVAVAGSFVLFRLAAAAFSALLRRLPRVRQPALRIALANISRPGAGTGAVMLSLGLGFALLVAVALIQGNLGEEVQSRLPKAAPSLFFIDIQPQQLAAFDKALRGTAGLSRLEQVPLLRGRIMAINGKPATESEAAPDARWVLRGDRGLTYAGKLPAGSTLVAGRWWPADYKGPPLVSVDANIAKGLGLRVGDALTVNVLGRNVTAKVASLRHIDWDSLGINFVMVFSPGTLEQAPHTFLASARVPPAQEVGLYKTVAEGFANVSIINLRDVLAAVGRLISGIGRAAHAAAVITLLIGVLVLGSTIAARQRRRLREAAILKALGATRAGVLAAHALEYGLLGMVTAVIAGGLGWAAAFAVVTRLLHAPWIPLPGTLAVTALGSILVTVICGLFGTWQALSVSPAQILRETH